MPKLIQRGFDGSSHPVIFAIPTSSIIAMLARNFKGPAEKIKVGTHRPEALGDGIFAIVMTLMVLG